MWKYADKTLGALVCFLLFPLAVVLDFAIKLMICAALSSPISAIINFFRGLLFSIVSMSITAALMLTVYWPAIAPLFAGVSAFPATLLMIGLSTLPVLAFNYACNFCPEVISNTLGSLVGLLLAPVFGLIVGWQGGLVASLASCLSRNPVKMNMEFSEDQGQRADRNISSVQEPRLNDDLIPEQPNFDGERENRLHSFLSEPSSGIGLFDRPDVSMRSDILNSDNPVFFREIKK